MHAFQVHKMPEERRRTTNARWNLECAETSGGVIDAKLGFIRARISSCCGDATCLVVCVQGLDLPRAIGK